ncbi:hypothetical protein [Nocardioides zeae]|uniref:JmjC domain-containing protein n=1 Tax=Nocardioides zeae TaxID=1457234 RepID=A0A6P0HNF6_9ACTN|nr:hypothetical protein [Nocardioides zeae]NEN79774.1 hypothetical protein [Nocardioides zeae]
MSDSASFFSRRDVPLVASPEQLWSALVSGATAVAQGAPHARRGDWKLFQGTSMLPEVEAFLPRPEDSGLASFIDRIDARIGDSGEWCLVVNSVQSFDARVFAEVRNWARELGLLLGTDQIRDGQFLDCFVVLGKYRDGPTSVHKDSADTWMQVLCGTKEMLLWDFDALAHLAENGGPDLVRSHHNLRSAPSVFPAPSAVLRGDAGSTLSWRHPYWHAARSDGRPGFSFHCALHHGGDKMSGDHSLVRRATAGGFRVVPPLSTAVGVAGPVVLRDPSLLEVIDDPRGGPYLLVVAAGHVCRVRESRPIRAAADLIIASAGDPLEPSSVRDPEVRAALEVIVTFLRNAHAVHP